MIPKISSIVFGNIHKNIDYKNNQNEPNQNNKQSNLNNYFNQNLYPKNYYINNISFGSFTTTGKRYIEKIGEENFPSPKIVEQLRQFGYTHNFFEFC